MGTSAFELQSRSGLTLRGDVHVPDGGPSGKLPTVVICHGFKGFKDWGFFPQVAARLALAGFAAIRFNFSGSGVGADLQTFSELDRFAADTVTAQLDDLGRVIDALERGEIAGGRFDVRRLAVLGHSRGGGTALLRARDDRRVAAVVTWAGLSTFERWSAEEQREWRARGYTEFLNTRTGQTMRVDVTYLDDLAAYAERYDVTRAVSELEVPILVVHGVDDTSVPAREARALHAAARPGRAELLLVPDAGHTFGVEHPWKGTTPALEVVLEHTITWLKASLVPLPEGSVPA